MQADWEVECVINNLHTAFGQVGGALPRRKDLNEGLVVEMLLCDYHAARKMAPTPYGGGHPDGLKNHVGIVVQQGRVAEALETLGRYEEASALYVEMGELEDGPGLGGRRTSHACSCWSNAGLALRCAKDISGAMDLYAKALSTSIAWRREKGARGRKALLLDDLGDSCGTQSFPLYIFRMMERCQRHAFNLTGDNDHMNTVSILVGLLEAAGLPDEGHQAGMSVLLHKHIKKPAKAMQSLLDIAEIQTGAKVLRAIGQCRNPDMRTKTFTRNAQPGSAEADEILRKQDLKGAKQTARGSLVPEGDFDQKMEAQTGNCRFCTKRGEVKILKACPCKLVEYCNRACQRNDCTLLLRDCFLLALPFIEPNMFAYLKRAAPTNTRARTGSHPI